MKASLKCFLGVMCLFASRPSLALVPINLSTRFASNTGVNDHRDAGNGVFSLSQYEFLFSLRAFNDDNYKAHLHVGLPLRSLTMTSGSSSFAGSEFGGYSVTWAQTLLGFIGWDLSHHSLESDRLQLTANTSNFETHLNVKTANFVGPKMLVRVHAGPGARLTQTTDASGTLFGPMLIAKAGIETIFAFDGLGKIGLSAAAVFRQRTRYESPTEPQMMANLFTVQPQIAWELVNDLWITAQFTKALARPIGFEQAMGDVGLSGLYGDSLGIGLSTMSF